MRWPGVIEPGRVINDICSLQDFIPTFAAANGEPDLVEKVKKGFAMGGKKFKVHLDGVNLLPFLSARRRSPRAKASFIGMMMASAWPFGWAGSRSCSPNSGRRASRRGASHCRRCAFRSFLTCGPTPSNAAKRAQIQGLVRRAESPAVFGAAHAREMARELQGVSAPCQGGKLQHRPGGREADAEIVAPRDGGSDVQRRTSSVDFRNWLRLGLEARERK